MGDSRSKAVPPDWVGPLMSWCVELAAGGRTRQTVELRRAHIAQAARALGGAPSTVTAEELLGWLASRTWRAVRRMVAGKESSLTPIGAARVLTFAKAASLTGSLLGGFFAAWIVVAAEHPSAPLNQDLLLSSAVNVAVCVLLVVVALVVEGWCRVPPPEDDPPANSSVTLA